MAVIIQETDYLDPVDDIGEPIVAVKDDPQMLAFVGGRRDGSVQVGPPPWIAAMLLEATEGIPARSPRNRWTGPSHYSRPGWAMIRCRWDLGQIWSPRSSRRAW